MFKTFVSIGSFSAVVAVILGAFGAHALEPRLLSNEMLDTYQTGVQYHFYHALGLVLIGLIATQLPASAWLKSAGWVMFAGIILFSGSLYLLSLADVRWVGIITPFGGVCFIASWVLLAVAVLKY